MVASSAPRITQEMTYQLYNMSFYASLRKLGLTKKRKERTKEHAPLLQNTRNNKGLQSLVPKAEAIIRKS